MSGNNHKKIAVHIQSEVQFFSLAPLLGELKKKYKNVRIVANFFEEDSSGFKEMVEGVRMLLQKNGYVLENVKKFKNEIFDLYLTPYIDNEIKARCFLKYEYGTLNIKPNLTYIPEAMERFHGFLCQSTITYELLKAYGATFPVDNLRFYGKKSKKNYRKKKTLLFAPTYNDLDDLDDIMKIIEQLKSQYYVIVKSHHGTNYLKENFDKKCVMEKLADEYYGSDINLSDLILRSDVCLFGNSSAIAEALYAGVPCAIFAKDLDYFKLGDIHTTQYELVKNNFLPYANKAENVMGAISDALTEEWVDVQKRLSMELFPKKYRTGIDGYMAVIEWFLESEVAGDYCRLHDYVIVQKYEAIEREAKEKEMANERIAQLESDIKEIKSSGLYQSLMKINKIKRRIINGKS